MIVAEIRVVPVGSGSSMEETVECVCEALEDCEVPYEMGPVSTTFEVETIEELMETVQCCQEAAMETAPRVILNLTIDQRKDEEETMQTLRETGQTESKSNEKGRRQGGANPRTSAKMQRRSRQKLEGDPRTPR